MAGFKLLLCVFKNVTLLCGSVFLLFYDLTFLMSCSLLVKMSFLKRKAEHNLTECIHSCSNQPQLN